MGGEKETLLYCIPSTVYVLCDVIFKIGVESSMFAFLYITQLSNTLHIDLEQKYITDVVSIFCLNSCVCVFMCVCEGTPLQGVLCCSRKGKLPKHHSL